tara:strand:+ start:183 stop:815 length:633 start_codon:yes stop_codon:yes gene_type:complete
MIKFIFLYLFFFILNSNELYCKTKIVLFGDSLMAGYGLEKKDHLSTILQHSLKNKGYDVKVINASISGDTTNGGLNRLNWTLEERDLGIFILCLGANDMLRGLKPEIIKDNLRNIIMIVKKRKIKILLAGMLAQRSYGLEYKSEFDKIYEDLAREFKIFYIPFLLEGVALKKEYNLPDGKHPNKKGIKIISNNIQKEIILMLKDEKNKRS